MKKKTPKTVTATAPAPPLTGIRPAPVHPLSPVMEAAQAVLSGTARRIDLAVTLDCVDYKVVIYRQLDKVVRCEFKTK